LGNATGTVGVEVIVGGGVFEGTEVRVGALVGKACVAEGTTAKVGVSVRGAFDGRLQADKTRTILSTNNKRHTIVSVLFGSPIDKLRGFIASLLYSVPSYLTRIALTRDHLDTVSLKQIEWNVTIHSILFCLLHEGIWRA
jgi:hypothetical protein